MEQDNYISLAHTYQEEIVLDSDIVLDPTPRTTQNSNFTIQPSMATNRDAVIPTLDPNVFPLLQTMQQQLQFSQQQLQQQLKQQQDQTQKLVSAINESKNSKPPTLRQIRGDRQIEDDLHRFEQHMEAYSIPKAKWPAELRAILKDEALSAFMTVSPADINNYDKIKTAILVRAGISPTNRVQRLLQMQPRLGQTAAQVYGHITNTLIQFSEGMTIYQIILSRSSSPTLSTTHWGICTGITKTRTRTINN